MSVERVQASQATQVVHGKPETSGKSDRNPQRDAQRRAKRSNYMESNVFLNALGQAIGTRIDIVA